MANIVNVKVKIDRSQMGKFVKQVEGLTAEATYQRLTRAAAFFETSAVRHMQDSGLVLNRSPHRRKHAPRLVVSLRARVDGTPSRFPMRLVLEPKPGVSVKKIASLEKGTKGHHIPTPVLFPRNNRKGKNGKIYGAVVRAPKQRNAYAKNNQSAKDGVNVRGRRGFHFIQGAFDDTVAALRSGRL